MIDADFEYFLEKFGQPQQAVRVTDNILNKYKGKLPDQLLEYWKEVGFCTFKEGLFWITNPDDYAEDIYHWLENTDILDEDVWHVIARSAFGELYLWGEKNWQKYDLNIINGEVFQNSVGFNDEKHKNDEIIRNFFAFSDLDEFDRKDENLKPLFDRAVKKYGPLSSNEVFGFEPALALGGKSVLQNLKKLDIHVHMAILKEFTNVYKTDLEGLGKILYGENASFSKAIEQVSQIEKTHSQVISIQSGQPCTKSGYWFTPAKENSRQYFKEGEIFPNFVTDWGEVYWQFDGDE
ncbi:type VI secretion system immunity protein, TaeI family [Acinetobacter baumannii]